MEKIFKTLLLLTFTLLLVFLLVSCGTNNALLPGRLRGVMSPNSASEEDLRTLGLEWKANLIRWQLKHLNPVNPCDMSEYDEWLTGALAELDQVMGFCNTYRIKVIIALMSTPGGRNANQENRIFFNPDYNTKFVEVWQRIALRYNRHPALLGYDLVNEPDHHISNPYPGLDYLSTQVNTATVIRKIDPSVKIFIEVLNGDGPYGFRNFQPVNLANVEYEVHMYEPHEFTHQQVQGNFPLVTTYPGTINGIYYDKNQLKAILQPVRDFQIKYNLPIYAGEFSAVRWAPGAAQYLKDCIDIFEEYGWNWSYNDYRNWTGWNLEHENGTPNSAPVPATVRTDRMKVVLAGLTLNNQ